MEKEWFKLIKLYHNIYAICEFEHYEKVISYLFIGFNKALLFDTGMGFKNISKAVKRLTKLPVFVINSHSHFDHIGGNKYFKDIAIFNSDWAFKIAREGISRDQIKKYTKGFLPKQYHISPFKTAKVIKDGEHIKLDPFEFEVLHTPGHTPDSICLLEKKEGLLLTGDTVYQGPIYLQFKEASLKDYTKSINKLKKISKIKWILPGHNQPKVKPDLLKTVMDKIML